jgi:hypothetical protein
MNFKTTRAPCQVPFYLSMVEVHLLISRPAGSILEYLSYVFNQELWIYIFAGLLSLGLGVRCIPSSDGLVSSRFALDGPTNEQPRRFPLSPFLSRG